MQLGLRLNTARQTIAECAIREAAEETGLQLRNDTGQAACRNGEVPNSTNVSACALLAQPHPFTAADVIRRDQSTGRIIWHYAIIEVRQIVKVNVTRCISRLAVYQRKPLAAYQEGFPYRLLELQERPLLGLGG